jgi:endo-1,4-beta-xylanase
MKARGKKYVGTPADVSLLSNSQSAAGTKAQFNQLTLENGMKWDTTDLSQNNLSRTHGCQAGLPPLTSVIRDHISKEGGLWAGKICGWDACNEILNEGFVCPQYTPDNLVIRIYAFPVFYNAVEDSGSRSTF